MSDKPKMTIKTPGDIPAVVGAFLGFVPTDSLVVMSVGGGPSARVDITVETLEDAVGALSTAARHWENGVILALHSTHVAAADVRRSFGRTMPNVPIRTSVTVWPDGTVIDEAGNKHAPSIDNATPEILARNVLASREEVVAEAARVDDKGEALALARASYLAGDGARAWSYVDRFTELHGGDTATSLLIRQFLTYAVDPNSPQGQMLKGGDD